MSAAPTDVLRIDVLTIFPEMFQGPLDHSILGRARKAGLVEVVVHDLRDFTTDKHRSVDDTPFGGGGGMVLKPEPLFRAVESLTGRPAGEHVEGEEVLLLSPAGQPHDQRSARRLAGLRRIILICGRYEGVDERVLDVLCTGALSLGDFVLSGGEPAAVAVIDSIVRLLPGALGNPEGTFVESFENGLLEAPHFTRPADFRGRAVPEVLLSGDHAAVRRWRREASLRATAERRPELLERAEAAGLDAETRESLSSLRAAADIPPVRAGA
jgi:tRNA (guanine37-N1)-methyltransferase